MTKMIKKSKCEFVGGYIVKKGEVIGLPRTVWLQLRKLETMVQQYMYLKGQPAYCSGPSLEGFEFRTSLMGDLPYVDMPETPVTDRRVEEALKFMEEADEIEAAVETNKMIDRFAALIDWCASDRFVEGPCVEPIESAEIGNPLDLKADEVAHVLGLIVNSPIVLGDE